MRGKRQIAASRRRRFDRLRSTAPPTDFVDITPTSVSAPGAPLETINTN